MRDERKSLGTKNLHFPGGGLSNRGGGASGVFIGMLDFRR